MIFLFYQSCGTNNDLSKHLPNQICEIINVVNNKYSFHIDSTTNTCGLLNDVYVYFPKGSTFNGCHIYLNDDSFKCDYITFKLLKNRDEFKVNKYRYFTAIGIKYLTEDGNSVIFLRGTDELFQRPGAAVGLDFSTSENYYMSKINGAWQIDSLVHDIRL
ncbi:MAG: hypothetical protein H6567_03425 [Lewinellaceae bacterium]|nr:hypothetical protein [Lewinellaceae bacterium]